MPFPLFLIEYGESQSNPTHKIKKTCREEGRPEFSHKKISRYTEKASVSASAGSITVEAAFCIPFFLFAAVCLIWILEMQAIRISVEAGMQEAGKRMAQQMYMLPLFSPAHAEAELVKSIGAQRMERSLIQGGSKGVSFAKSYMQPKSKIMELRAAYKVKIPIPIFRIPTISVEEKMRVKTWTGYVKGGFTENETDRIVYITETGIVYHMNYHCNYLELSIQSVPAEEVEQLRNESQGKYYPCESCMKHTQSAGAVYITDYGDRYHSSLGCSGLKRRIYSVPLSEVKGKGACSKCGK